MNTASSSLDAFDVFVDTAIRKLWKALDKDNLGLVNEDYYIGQLKALDSILSSSSQGDGCGCIYRIHYWGNNKYQTTDHWEIPLLGIVIGGSV